MADTLGRLIKRVAAGTASTSNLFAPQRALGSGAVQVWLTSDLNHLGAESPYRTLASIPGFETVKQASPTAFAEGEPAVWDFDWRSSQLTEEPPANACLGSHLVHRCTTGSRAWPRAVLRARVETHASPSDKLGAILVCCPGRLRAPDLGCASKGALVPGSGGAWVDLDLALPLEGTYFESMHGAVVLGAGSATGASAPGEPVFGHVATFWCAFFSTSGAVQVTAITLGLEPAP